jgi:hypothetical protein
MPFMSNDIVIATPLYQESLQDSEIMRLSITVSNNPKTSHIFFCPEDLATKNLEKAFPNSSFLKFPNHHFRSVQTYSNLLLRSSFYESFIDYDYLVVSQLDSVVIRELSIDLFGNYDYIGAAWVKEINAFSIGNRLFLNSGKHKFLPNRVFSVGNGGLSVRKTNSMVEIAHRIQNPIFRVIGLGTNVGLNEDVVISYSALKYGYSVADRDTASSIFVEEYRKEPFDPWSVYGYHAIEKTFPLLQKEIFEKYSSSGLIDYTKE